MIQTSNRQIQHETYEYIIPDIINKHFLRPTKPV